MTPERGPAWWHWDLRSDQWHNSPAIVELLGDPTSSAWERAEYLARIHPEDRSAVEQAWAKLADGSLAQWAGHYRMCGHDGRVVALHDFALLLRDDHGPRQVFGSVSAHALEHRSQQPQRQLSEGEFRTFVDSIPALAWTARPDGWIDFYNRRWFDYTGTTFESQQGWGWVVVHDPDDLPRVLRLFRESLTTGQPWEDEVQLRRASDGALRWHLSRMMPVRDEQGRLVRWFGTNTDVHDQKLALAEHTRLLAAEHRARQVAEASNRAKDEFLAVVSHELRTPLNAILGWAQLMSSDPTADVPRWRDAIARIERNALQQARLIEDLLEVSRIIAGKLSIERVPVDFAAAVRAALGDHRLEAERRGLTLQLLGLTQVPPVAGDASRLQQIVGNLLGNAIKFSHDNGTIEVTLGCDGEQVALEIRDHGVGLTPELAEHLFERFWQADRSNTRKRGGLGLGLAIAHHLVQLHGGTITAHSDGPGTGARFAVTLPLSPEPVVQPSVSEPPAAAPSLAGLRVLAVDDEGSAREVIAAVLLSCGATVTVAASAAEALRALQRESPDVIVSDLAMPEIDGFALLVAIRALPDPRRASTPVIAFSAHGGREDEARSLAAGFARHVAKPIRPAVLARAILETARARIVEGE